uniref:Autoinducer 2-degrading protein n=1 Tax=Candidatus Kentrum sp. TUN TaxID=2126343 RepID=A0A450ZF66_9GAMM|nr:MAG: autoinducer 2-degrading protein [Candidatus Kentron sp. TUN]VFK52937.1 MAG: autoinducer 2-degrading protein [Candidatus Kentron sp. TUN]VFK57580.1 MAG: autoinducer 2-degrading protein [Candidatus Kentron sp. TUN]
MIVTCVTVYVKSENIDDFIKASKKNHEGSIREPSNLRFDVLQSKDDPSRFLLYEAYENEEGAAAHKNTAHYLTWREAVAPWMEKPREGVPYVAIVP